jgi:hypothetical protein
VFEVEITGDCDIKGIGFWPWISNYVDIAGCRDNERSR